MPPLFQVDLAQAAGVAFPVMTTLGGRPVLKYSDLLPRMNAPAADKEAQEEIERRDLGLANARLRAERLKALKAQSSSAAAAAAAASASASASALAAAKAAPVKDVDSDDEGFMHATAVGKLPEHLIRSESQESADSDVILDKQDDERQQSAESQQRVQQDPKRDKQAAYQVRYGTIIILNLPWLQAICLLELHNRTFECKQQTISPLVSTLLSRNVH